LSSRYCNLHQIPDITETGVEILNYIKIYELKDLIKLEQSEVERLPSQLRANTQVKVGSQSRTDVNEKWINNIMKFVKILPYFRMTVVTEYLIPNPTKNAVDLKNSSVITDKSNGQSNTHLRVTITIQCSHGNSKEKLFRSKYMKSSKASWFLLMITEEGDLIHLTRLGSITNQLDTEIIAPVTQSKSFIIHLLCDSMLGLDTSFVVSRP
jgi:hypothetical protein